MSQPMGVDDFLQRVTARIATLEELISHHAEDPGGRCHVCGQAWPCARRSALEPELQRLQYQLHVALVVQQDRQRRAQED